MFILIELVMKKSGAEWVWISTCLHLKLSHATCLAESFGRYKVHLHIKNVLQLGVVLAKFCAECFLIQHHLLSGTLKILGSFYSEKPEDAFWKKKTSS